jgi:hypothetical protein
VTWYQPVWIGAVQAQERHPNGRYAERVPSFDDAPKAYTTALVAVTLNGRRPSDAMRAQLERIRTAWIGYWSKVTGGVSTMETSPGR